MALDDLVRNGIATANRLTDSLQASVQLYAWTADDGLGGATYASPVTLKALVETKQRILRTNDGQEVLVAHTVTILQPVAANGAAGRREPIDNRDKIVLSNGATGQILAVDGFTDPDTSASYFYQVYLGH